MRPEELRAKLKEFGKAHGLDLLILFGSHAKGTAHGGSDVDLAFWASNPVDLTELSGELISSIHKNDIDVVDLRYCDPLVGMIALREGEVLIRKPTALGTASSYVSRRFADTQKFRNAMKRSLAVFLESQKKS